jgi:hypothetical protein
MGEQMDVDPIGRATMLCRTVEQQSEGSDERLAKLMRECVREVSLADESALDPSLKETETDEIERLRAFAARQQTMRKKYGSMRGRLTSGDQ